MKNFTYWISFFLLIFSISSQASSSENFVPRLWKAEKINAAGENIKIYVLGITHFGLPVEYDEYFYKKVIPIFKTAETFSFEGAGDREDEPEPVCQIADLDEKAKVIFFQSQNEIVEAAIQDAINKKNEAYLQGIKDPRSNDFIKMSMGKFIRSQDEFELMMISRNYAVSQRKWESDSQSLVKGTVVSELIKNKAIKIRDIDSKYAVKKIYCSSGSERISFFTDYVYGGELSEGDGILTLTAEFKDMLKTGRVANSAHMNLGSISKGMVCERNKNWVNDMLKINDSDVHFFAVGATHINDFSSKNIRCNGVLSLLSEEGFTISIVK